MCVKLRQVHFVEVVKLQRDCFSSVLLDICEIPVKNQSTQCPFTARSNQSESADILRLFAWESQPESGGSILGHPQQARCLTFSALQLTVAQVKPRLTCPETLAVLWIDSATSGCAV